MTSTLPLVAAAWSGVAPKASTCFTRDGSRFSIARTSETFPAAASRRMSSPNSAGVLDSHPHITSAVRTAAINRRVTIPCIFVQIRGGGNYNDDMIHRRRRLQGFTLVELLVVIGIIAVLIAIL